MNRRFLRRAVSHVMVGLMVLAVVAALLPLFLILGDLVAKGAGSLSFDFFTRTPAPAGETGINWSGGMVRPGMYFARMVAADGAHGTKVIVQ